MPNTYREALARSLETDIARLSEELEYKRECRGRVDAGQFPRERSYRQREERVGVLLNASQPASVTDIRTRRPRSRTT